MSLDRYSKETLRLANLFTVPVYGKTIEEQLKTINGDLSKAMMVGSAALIGKEIEAGKIDMEKLKELD